MVKKLSGSQVKAKLKLLNSWKLKRGKLHRELKFRSFVDAFAFMTAAALEAEKMNHHPEWSNVYATVKIDLNTHCVAGITKLDFQLARKMEGLAMRFLAKT